MIGFVLLGYAQPENSLNFIFPIFYGASLGIITIVRALAVPQLIGPEAYGALNGLLGLASAMALAVARRAWFAAGACSALAFLDWQVGGLVGLAAFVAAIVFVIFKGVFV